MEKSIGFLIVFFFDMRRCWQIFIQSHISDMFLEIKIYQRPAYHKNPLLRLFFAF